VAKYGEIIVQHAKTAGVNVFEEISALLINFANNNIKGCPIAAKWEIAIGSIVSGTISFDYLINATGKSDITAQKYLKRRNINTSLRSVACWAYQKGTGMYAPGTSGHNVPWFEALTGMFSLLNAVDFI
jgi:flavine halogenase